MGGVRALDLRPTEGGGARAIVTHLGPTVDGGGGGARDSNTPRTYGRQGGGGGCARDRNTPRTYDRRANLWPAGVSQKGGQIRVRLDAAPDAGQGFKKPDSLA